MAGEDDGTGQGQPSEDYREYRRMMDAAGREGLLRMIEHLTGDLRANPRDTEALLARGLAYSELGDHRRAAEDNSRVIALDPDNADAYFERARAYSEMGEHRPALEDYDAALRLAPGDATAHYSRGGAPRSVQVERSRCGTRPGVGRWLGEQARGPEAESCLKPSR